jgi:hypothetical protein
MYLLLFNYLFAFNFVYVMLMKLLSRGRQLIVIYQTNVKGQAEKNYTTKSCSSLLVTNIIMTILSFHRCFDLVIVIIVNYCRKTYQDQRVKDQNNNEFKHLPSPHPPSHYPFTIVTNCFFSRQIFCHRKTC